MLAGLSFVSGFHRARPSWSEGMIFRDGAGFFGNLIRIVVCAFSQGA